MGNPQDPEDLRAVKDLLIANMIRIDTVTQLLIDKGVFSGEEFYDKLKHIQADYQRENPDN